MSYTKFCSHISSECPACLSCPFLCDLEKVFTKFELEEHVKECPNGMTTCAKCDADIPNNQMASHDCILYLKSIINLKNERILALMDENQRLKNEVPEEERG
jgi:hypothetical protein